MKFFLFFFYILFLSHFFFSVFCFSSEIPSIQNENKNKEGKSQKILSELKRKIGEKEEFFEKKIQRIGNKTITLSISIATEANTKTFVDTFQHHENFSNWILPQINIKPDGGKFIFQFLELKPDPKDSQLLHISLAIELPFFHHNSTRALRFKHDQTSHSSIISATLAPSDTGIVDTAEAELWIFPTTSSPDKTWIFFEGKMKLRSWFLYEALPEKLLQRETGTRVQILKNSYIEYEDKLRKLKPEKKSGKGNK